MRLAPRLFRRPATCLVPATPSELIERGLEAARDVMEVAAEAIEAAPHSHRGRNTAVTVAAVTATALVATAAYVWWKRRDRVASIDVAPVAMPPATVSTAVEQVGTTDDPATATAESRPTPAPERLAPVVAQASIQADDCAGARRETPQPSVTVGTPHSARPPLMSGRFAMPEVRGIVLPGGGGSLP